MVCLECMRTCTQTMAMRFMFAVAVVSFAVHVGRPGAYRSYDCIVNGSILNIHRQQR